MIAAESVLATGDYIIADKSIYMFCSCEQDHSEDCIKYIVPSQIMEKTRSRTLYSEKAHISLAKKVRPGVYRFDFQQTESNHYIFIENFPTERKFGCIVDLHWRTISEEIYKDGVIFLRNFRNQESYN